MNIRKLALLLIITSLAMILISCTGTGSQEVDTIGIIVSMALDLDGDEVVLTSQVITPSQNAISTTMGTAQKHVQSRGKTILEAVRNATMSFDRRLYIPHNSIIIISEDFAKRGIGDFINFFAYDAEPRETAYMMVAKGTKASEILANNPASGDHLIRLIELIRLTSKSRSITIFEFFKYYMDRGTPVLTVIELVEKPVMNENTNKVEMKTIPSIEGGAPFYEDKLLCLYTEEEMIGFNFLVDEIEGGLIIFEVPDELVDKSRLIATSGKYTTVEILKSKTKNKVEIKDGKIHLKIDVILQGALAEETKGIDMTKSDIKNAIEDACSNKVKEYISGTLDRAQNELGVDTFGIDSLVHRKYPEVWREISKEWQKGIFSDITYEIKVETRLERTGLVIIPTNIRREKD